MALEIKSNLFPYRLVLSRKQPVELSVELTNSFSEKRLVSLQLALARGIAFDKSGLRCGDAKQLGEMASGDSKKFYYNIYPKQGIRAARYPIQIRVFEHHRNYDYVTKKVTKNLVLRVED